MPTHSCVDNVERAVWMYGYNFRPHDGTGLFCPRNINVYSSAGGNVHRRCPHAGVTSNVRAVGIYPLFRGNFGA